MIMKKIQFAPQQHLWPTNIRKHLIFAVQMLLVQWFIENSWWDPKTPKLIMTQAYTFSTQSKTTFS